VVNNILRQNLGEIFILFELLNSMWKCTEFEVNKERKDVFFTTSFQLLLARFMRLNGTFFLKKIYIENNFFFKKHINLFLKVYFI
jgi:hypothetical protein